MIKEVRVKMLGLRGLDLRILWLGKYYSRWVAKSSFCVKELQDIVLRIK
ncbi:hypothetical protein [Clostridium saccharobutylicum]|nr:hypothetical protein [Clostridium saccharobutylicum]